MPESEEEHCHRMLRALRAEYEERSAPYVARLVKIKMIENANIRFSVALGRILYPEEINAAAVPQVRPGGS
ncbi:MAG: hypothetical protein RLZZ524_2919 [Pseudomonadota bacterium]|jgi:hypothetical protein